MDYFFGCWDKVGHFLYTRRGERIVTENSALYREFPLKNFYALDGGLLFKGDKVSVWWTETGWTFIAMQDNTIDKRPGSNCVYILNGEYDLDRAVEYIEFNFNSQVNRRLSKQLDKEQS